MRPVSTSREPGRTARCCYLRSTRNQPELHRDCESRTWSTEGKCRSRQACMRLVDWHYHKLSMAGQQHPATRHKRNPAATHDETNIVNDGIDLIPMPYSRYGIVKLLAPASGIMRSSSKGIKGATAAETMVKFLSSTGHSLVLGEADPLQLVQRLSIAPRPTIQITITSLIYLGPSR